MADARDIRSALGASMRTEKNRAIDRKLNRFARGEAASETTGAAQPENTDTPAMEHQRVIRDSFGLPTSEYALIATLREKALKAGDHTQFGSSASVSSGRPMLLIGRLRA
jgi:hypothetical protein